MKTVRSVAEQVNELGTLDAVIHNAGVYRGAQILPVNVVAPYLLTGLMHRPARLIYLSSGKHHGGRPRVTGVDWSGRRPSGSYSDSKLFVTTLMAAMATRWPSTISNAVDPGCVPTRMGGAGASDDLRLGQLTQEWLATSDDADATASEGNWYHRQRRQPHPAVHDPRFQQQLLDELLRFPGVGLD